MLDNMYALFWYCLSIIATQLNMTSHPIEGSNTSLAHHQPNPKPTPQFILFGDSITQGSFFTLTARLGDLYARRLDVVSCLHP